MRTRLLVAAAALGAIAVAIAAHPSDASAADPSCSQPASVDNFQLLRRLSLDLRGYPPTMAEYDAVESGADPLSIAQQWSTHWDPEGAPPDASHEAFRQQMREYHKALLWPNVTFARLTNVAYSLRQTGTDYDGGVSYLTGRTKAYYSANPDWTAKPDLTNSNSAPICDPTRPQPSAGYYTGDTYYRPIPQTDTYPDGGTHQWVGYRDVVPYWKTDGGTTRVCAYEAQETPSAGYYRLADGGWLPFVTSPDGGGVQVSCDSAAASNAAFCGCGPNLRYCFGSTVQTDVENDMAEQMMKIVDRSTVGGQPYTDVIQTPVSYVDGRLAFYKKYLSDMNTAVAITYTEDDPGDHVVPASSFDPTVPGAIPDLDYNDPSWHRITRSEQHAGVLTTPAYLLRFMTNRSRANRFRIDFLCNYFVPPDQLTDAPPACNPASSDLMRKCNCRLCHATLEPLAAHWGQFSEAGFSLLEPDAGFPEYDPTCSPDGGSQRNSQRCARYYVNTTEYDVGPGLPDDIDGTFHRYGGQLKTYLYNDLHNDVIADNLLHGKDDLRSAYIDNPGHDFAHCTVKKVFAYFMRRDMRLVGADNDEAALLEQLAADFETDYDFSRLVMKIVSLPQYRRVR